MFSSLNQDPAQSYYSYLFRHSIPEYIKIAYSVNQTEFCVFTNMITTVL